MNLIETRFLELKNLIPEFLDVANHSIKIVADLLIATFSEGSKVLLCGNGGSAADAQHFAAEFVNAFARDIHRPALPAISLSTDTSILTSIANDFSYDNIFSRQVEAYGKKGDILILFTTSGNSRNCIRAAECAKTLDISTIAFTRKNAEISKFVDFSIEVPSTNTQHIQECHILTYHVLTEIVESKLFGGNK